MTAQPASPVLSGFIQRSSFTRSEDISAISALASAGVLGGGHGRQDGGVTPTDPIAVLDDTARAERVRPRPVFSDNQRPPGRAAKSA